MSQHGFGLCCRCGSGRETCPLARNSTAWVLPCCVWDSTSCAGFVQEISCFQDLLIGPISRFERSTLDTGPESFPASLPCALPRAGVGMVWPFGFCGSNQFQSTVHDSMGPHLVFSCIVYHGSITRLRDLGIKPRVHGSDAGFRTSTGRATTPLRPAAAV